MTPVTLLTLTVSTGTGTATYRYADVQTDAYPAHAPRLAGPADLEESAATPLTRSLPVRRARVRLSNIAVPHYATSAPTVSQILGAGQNVVGAQASVQVADADTQTVLTTIGGYVEEIAALSLSEATLIVSDALAGDASTLLPCALTDLFPSVQAPDGTALAVILGPARRVRLYPVSQADVVKVEIAIGAGTGQRRINLNYRRRDAGVVVAAGDRIVYEIWRTGPTDDVFLLARFSDGSNNRRDADGWTDQNGLANSAYAGSPRGCMGWYRRVLTAPASFVGMTLWDWRMGIYAGAGDAYTGTVRFARAALLDAAGTVKDTFIGQDVDLDDNPVVQRSGATGTFTPSVDPDAGYSFGAWRTGTGVRVANAYLNGRRMAPSEYAVVSPLPGVSALKLTDPPGDGAVVHADFTTTEFAGNPARVTRFFLMDAHHGLGRPVDQISFPVAYTAFAEHGSRGIPAWGPITVGGAVTKRTPAATLLQEFLLHGAVLTHAADGTIGMRVDGAGTRAALELGHADETGWHNFTPANAAPVRAAAQPKSLLVRGVLDPGFAGEPERWLATTKRSRTFPRGAEQEVRYRYIVDPDSLDRQAHYLWEQMQAQATPLTGDLAVTEPDAYALNVGDRLVVTVPGLGLTRADYRIGGFRNRGAQFGLTLYPYRAAAFVYAAGTDREIEPQARQLVDYSRTQPQAPTITAATANAPVALPDNREEITISATATAPAANVEALVFRALRTGSAVNTDEVVQSCTPGQTGVAATLKVDPKLTYTIQVYARNQTNDPGFQLSPAAMRSVTSLGTPRIGYAVWHVGSGVPASSVGANGDFYLRTDTNTVYRKSTGTWTQVADLRGADGATWSTGSGTPTGGRNGDWYFRTTDASIWRKGAGTWTKLLDIDGADGATWYGGSGAPGGSLGNVGDWYFRTSNGHVFKKTGSSTWTFQRDITGPQGLPGDDGLPGPGGLSGYQYSISRATRVASASLVTNPGQYYLSPSGAYGDASGVATVVIAAGTNRGNGVFLKDIQLGSLVTLYFAANNWADFTVSALTQTVLRGVIIRYTFTLQKQRDDALPGTTVPTPPRSGAMEFHFSPRGQRGIAGATWHQGSGVPASSVGANGDFYLRTASGDVYRKSGGSWSRIANLHGADGASWHTGSGTPTGGSDGDWYFRTTDASIWRKGAGTWTKLLDIDGADGATWYGGSGAPGGSLGNVGDWYFRTSNGYVSKKTGASTWTFQRDITGPQGPRSLPGFSNSIELRGYDLTPGGNWSALTGWSTSPFLTGSAWPSSIRYGIGVVVSTTDRKLMARVEAGASIAIARDNDNFGIYRTTGFYGPRSTVGTFNNLTLINSAGTAGFKAGSSGRLYFTPQGTAGAPGTPAKIVLGRAVVETNQETVGTGTLQMCNTSISNVPTHAIVFLSFSATLTFSSAIQNQDLTLVLKIGRNRTVTKQQAVRLGTTTGSFRSNGSAIVGISRAFVVGEGAGTYTMYAGVKKATRQTGTFRIDEKELQVLIYQP